MCLMSNPLDRFRHRIPYDASPLRGQPRPATAHTCPECGGKNLERKASDSSSYGCCTCGHEWDEATRQAMDAARHERERKAKFASLRESWAKKRRPKKSA